jgi:hypothetical protein
MRAAVAPFRLFVLLLSVAACSKTALTQPKADAAADASTIGADALAALALPDVAATPADGTHIVLPEVKRDAVGGPEVDPLACARTLSGQEDPGFPLTWAAAREPTAWCGFSPYYEWWTMSENPSGYNQVVLTTSIYGEMAISYEAVYLYDSTTGKFVQGLLAGPFREDVTCTVRAPDTPLSATMGSVPVGGMALGTYCPGKSDAGL